MKTDTVNQKQMCDNCRFWEQILETGICRRFPPHKQLITGGAWQQPQTNFNQWCGEYKEK